MMASIAGYLDDRMNPIVVKEVRQAVRSRFVTAVLILFLLAQLVTLGIYLLSQSDVSLDFYAGRDIFMFLQGALLATCLFFVPLYVGVRLAAERLDSNADLLFITTIRPSSIIWGKWLAGCLVAVVIFSACAPFMVLTYLLRGVDLPSILLVLGLDLLMMIVAIQLAILLACVPVSGLFKIILGVGFLFVLGMGFSGGMGGAGAMLYAGVGSAVATWDFWGPVLATVAICLAVMGLMFVLSLAMLTPSTANRALPVRLYLLGAWGVTGAIVIAVDLSQRTADGLYAWAMVWLFLLGIGVLAAVSEREHLGPRLRRHIPRRLLLRLPAFLFYSGAAGGLVFQCLLLALTVSVTGIAWTILYGRRFVDGNELQDLLAGMCIVWLYVLAYGLAGMLIRRYLLGPKVRPHATAVISLMLAATGALLPPLVMFMISPHTWDRGDKLWLLTNPIGVFNDLGNAPARFRFWLAGGIACAILIPLSLPWLIEQVRRFKPLPIGESVEPDPRQAAEPPVAELETV